MLYLKKVRDCRYSEWFFFFDDTATTEIYTYLHTLSLLDALPILSTASSFVSMMTATAIPPCSTSPSGWASCPMMRCPSPTSAASIWSPWSRTRNPKRSEEHTSELQSLMRISYAVFCLKKNTHNNTCTNHTYVDHSTTTTYK